jgi:hypothetical protein
MNITLFLCSSFLLTIILWFVGIKISLSDYYSFEVKLFAVGVYFLFNIRDWPYYNLFYSKPLTTMETILFILVIIVCLYAIYVTLIDILDIAARPVSKFLSYSDKVSKIVPACLIVIIIGIYVCIILKNFLKI